MYAEGDQASSGRGEVDNDGVIPTCCVYDDIRLVSELDVLKCSPALNLNRLEAVLDRAVDHIDRVSTSRAGECDIGCDTSVYDRLDARIGYQRAIKLNRAGRWP